MDSSQPAGASLLSLSLHRLKRHPRPPDSFLPSSTIFRHGRNIWKTATSSRASFLVDADAYFRAFAAAAATAEHQLFIIGWDTDSRTELPCPEGIDIKGIKAGEPVSLGKFLECLALSKPQLRIYVLSWDFAFIYLFERESLPGVKFSALHSDRIRFVLDREHPRLASHHQKIVVVDDQVAFSGGLDITQRRWDTPEHRGHDARRVDPGGHSYGPFHDVQICVEGEAAKALGDIARERWHLATAETILRVTETRGPVTEARGPVTETRGPVTPQTSAPSHWPSYLAADLENVEVGIARTLPYGYLTDEEGHPSKPVLEVERLFLDAIRSAKRFVYIENQYFTSPMIARAIAKRLREEDGPEFVLVLPRDQTGWIEESTMGLLRSRALRLVESADQHGRFKCYHPIVPDLAHGYVKIHSKVMVIDDELVRVGSANMNNRSMGMDTECDLAIEARGNPHTKEAIGRLRRVLASEHLGCDPDEFEQRFLTSGSLLQTVESFRGGPRTLIEIRPTVPEWVGKIAPPKEWIDPTSPLGFRRWWAKRVFLHRHAIAAALILTVTFGLLALRMLESAGYLPEGLRTLRGPGDGLQDIWLWVRSWDAEKISAVLEQVQGHPMAVPGILLGFVVGTLVFVPITAMILGVALSFPSSQALALSLSGTLLAGLNLYGIGRYWAFTKSRTLARPWVRRLADKMNRGGVWAVTAVRLTPIAPFAAVGIVAGGLRIRLRDYMLGTTLGLLPGITAITLLSQGAAGFAQKRNWMGVVWVVLALIAFSLLLPRLIRRLRRTA